MKIGKLYQVKKFYWFLYPSKERAAAAAADAWWPGDDHGIAALHGVVAAQAAQWSEHFKCNVTFVSENSIFCLLEEDGNFLKILSTNGELGWMIYRNNEERNKGCIEEVKE